MTKETTTMTRYLTCLMPFVALAALAMTPACGDDDDDNPSTQGSGGRAGTGGSGTGGSGTGGSGTGGTGGGAGMGGMGGGAGMGGAPALPPPTPASFDVLALGEGSKLYYFKSDAPGSAKQATITGADADFTGIDVRSSDGLIYGLTANGKLYKVTVDTSGADLVATAAEGRAVPDLVVGEGGVAFDFNPKSAIPTEKGGDGGNALRVITDTNNYRLNPTAPSVAGVDKALAYKDDDVDDDAAIQIVAAGYTNAYKGTMGTTLYDINAATDTLVRQGDPDPNEGVLVTVGALNIDIQGEAGFDIVATTDQTMSVVNTGFLVHAGTFYSVNLGTGAATAVGAVAGATGLRGVVAMVPR
jgi:hypothetical protein